MDHVFWVVEASLAGRPGPDLEPWEPRELAEAGFRSVLSVDDEPPDEYELSAVGIRSLWHPIPLDVPPNEGTTARCREALPLTYEHLSGEVSAGRPALVHCLGGCDRTGLVLANFLLKSKNLSPAAALEELRKSRPEALSMGGWQAFALDLLRRYAAA